MANGDFVLGDQHLLHDEPDDALPFGDVQGFGGRVQPRQKAGQRLGEPEIGLAILRTIDGGLQFAIQRLLLTAEFGRSVAQLVDRDQLLLIGVDQAADAFSDPDQTVPQVVLALLAWIGGAGRLQSPIDLGADQCRILEQADHFAPDDVIEQVLAHRPTVAQRPVEMAPGVGTQAAVIGDLAGTRPGRCARQRVAAFAARDQSLDHAGRLGTARRVDLVHLQPLFGQGEGLFADDRRQPGEVGTGGHGQKARRGGADRRVRGRASDRRRNRGAGDGRALLGHLRGYIPLADDMTRAPVRRGDPEKRTSNAKPREPFELSIYNCQQDRVRAPKRSLDASPQTSTA